MTHHRSNHLPGDAGNVRLPCLGTTALPHRSTGNVPRGTALTRPIAVFGAEKRAFEVPLTTRYGGPATLLLFSSFYLEVIEMRLLVVASIVCAFAAPLPAQNNTSLDARRAQLRDALQAEWEYTLRTNPKFATYVGDNRYNDRLGDYSPKAIAQGGRARQAATQALRGHRHLGIPRR